MNRNRFQNSALTLVELLVALMVTAIILGAVSAIVFAMNTANKSTETADRFETQFRFTTIKVNDLIRYCKLVTNIDSSGFSVWRNDNNNDGLIDANETAIIEYDSNTRCLQLVEFLPPPAQVSVPLDLISFQNGISGTALKSNCNPRYTVLMRNCSNIHFITDQSPPNTTLLCITFDYAMDGVARTYQINAGLRCWSGFQFNEAGGLNSSDDDARI